MYSINQASSLTKLVERAELSAKVAFWVNATGTKSKGKSLEGLSFTLIQAMFLLSIDRLFLQAVVPLILAREAIL